MTTYRKDPRALEATVGSSLVVLNTESLKYFELTEVASTIWKLLDEGRHSLDSLVANLVNEYDVTEAVCRSEVQQFLSDSVDKGLVIGE